jgi:hypothetical protein
MQIVPYFEELIACFPNKAMTTITRDPNYADINLICCLINNNTIKIISYIRGGRHGHIALVMTGEEYMDIAGEKFEDPENSGSFARNPDGATSVEVNITRLRFTTLATVCDRPVRASDVVEAKTRLQFVEITEKCKISQRITLDPPPLVPYTSNIGTCIEALPRHVQRLVGDIPALRTTAGLDPTTPVNIIIATDGSVTFGVG